MAVDQPLALIHCTLGKAGNWRGFLKELDSPVSPLLIELPGHGNTEDWNPERDYSTQAAESVLSELPSTPISVIGHSYGAALALKLAVEHPGRISSLVLVEPVLFAAAEGRWAYDKIIRDLDALERKLKAAQFATAAKQFHKLWNPDLAWSDLSTDQRGYIVNRIGLIPAQNTYLLRDETGVLRPGMIEGIDIPVTFVDGGQTHPVIAEIVNAIGDRLSDAEWVSIPDASHMLPLTHPKALAEAVKGRLFV